MEQPYQSSNSPNTLGGVELTATTYLHADRGLPDFVNTRILLIPWTMPRHRGRTPITPTTALALCSGCLYCPNHLNMHSHNIGRLIPHLSKNALMSCRPVVPTTARECLPLRISVIKPAVPMNQHTRRGIITSPNKSLHIMSETDINRETSFNQEVFNLSLALSRNRMNDATELRCMALNADGSVKHSELRGTKADVAKQYGLDGRDLRNVDLVSEGIPHVLVRPSTIFISMFTLRLLVRSDEVLLFILPIEDSDVKVQDVFLKDLQSKLDSNLQSGLVTKLPYELRVVDAALASVIATLEAEHILIRREVKESLNDSTREELAHSVLRGLQDHGKRLVAIGQRARQVRSALQELLSSDEDMATMYLSDNQFGKRHAIQDHQDVEYLLEAYYKNADAIAESANALLEDVNRTTNTTLSILDVRRNQIMIFEAKLEICMLGFAVPTFVAGLFGMNVINYFEESAYAFAVLVGASVMGTALISKYGMWKLNKYRKLRF